MTEHENIINKLSIIEKQNNKILSTLDNSSHSNSDELLIQHEKVIYVSQLNEHESQNGSFQSPFNNLEDAVRKATILSKDHKDIIILILDDNWYTLYVALRIPANTKIIGHKAKIDACIYMDSDNASVCIDRHELKDEYDDEGYLTSLVIMNATNLSYKANVVKTSHPKQKCFDVEGSAKNISIDFNDCYLNSNGHVMSITHGPQDCNINVRGDKVISKSNTTFFYIANSIEDCRIFIDIKDIVIMNLNNKIDSHDGVITFTNMYDPGFDNIIMFNCTSIRDERDDENSKSNHIHSIQNLEFTSDGVENHTTVLWRVLEDISNNVKIMDKSNVIMM